MLRTEAQDDVLSFPGLYIRQLAGDVQLVLPEGQAAVFHLPANEVHGRLADESGHKDVFRLIIELIGRADLLDVAVLHDHNPVRQGHGLGLVVGDVDGRGAGFLMNLGDFIAHRDALFRVQVGQRLVHQEDADLPDNRPADGYALTLAAGQGPGQTIQVVRQAQDSRDFLDPLLNDILVHPLQRQAEGDVVVDGHLGIQGIALEHHGDLPLPGSLLIGPYAVDQEFAAGDVLQAGNHPQGRGLSAAGGSDENHELALLNFQIEIVDGMIAIGIDLVDVLQG